MVMNAKALTAVILLTGLWQASAAAQPADTIYRLNEFAGFEVDCMPPCPCSEFFSGAVVGAFALGPAMPGNVVDFHEVRQIDWTVGAAGGVLHRVTGSGNYRITNFGAPFTHALELSLSIDGGPPQFFSGDFSDADAIGSPIDLTVTAQTECHNLSIRVSAEVSPPSAIVPYRLLRGSTYQQGCFDPCDCILETPQPLRGGFTLVELSDNGTVAEFSLLDVSVRRTAIRGAQLSELAMRGTGRYTLIQGFAGPAHELRLTIHPPFGAPDHFDNELVNTMSNFPRIDAVIDLNDMVCFDKVLAIRALPTPERLPYQPPSGLPLDALRR